MTVSLPLPVRDTTLDVAVDVSWVPRLLVDGSEDARELGITISDVEIRNEPAAEPRRRWGSGWLGRLRTLRLPISAASAR